MIPFLKKNKDGKKPPKPTVLRTAQESIPFQRMFEDGTCRVRPGYYTRTIQYQDINYQLAQQEDKTAIFEEWWGGSTPETGFDCSGYVCWVYNQNGYDVGRTTANGLWNKSQHISEAEAKPGDLVFFEGTYDTPGKSHVGIYLGNGMMVSAGDPIKYANIHSSYWQKYLSGFGRLSK